MHHSKHKKAAKSSFLSPLYAYAIIVFIITLADALLAYTAPLLIERTYNNTSIVGMLLATSSVAGVLFDFFAGDKLAGRNYKFFFWATIMLQVAAACILLFNQPTIIAIVIAFACWGMYFETAAFANFNFIHKFVEFKRHNQAWGIIYSYKSLAYLIAPLFAIFLLDISNKAPQWGILTLTFMATMLFSSFLYTYKKTERNRPKNNIRHKKGIAEEFKIWAVLMKKIWPLWFFSVSIMIVDSAFWSIGILYAERLRQIEPIGGLFIVAFMLPQVLMGLLIGKLLPPTKKKEIAFLMGILTGIMLIVLWFVNSIINILTVVFLASIFYAVANTEILAVYEDYVARIDSFKNDLIGLERTGESFAYIIGPIGAGFIANSYDFKTVFLVAGLIILFFSALAIMYGSKNITMPQKKLKIFDF